MWHFLMLLLLWLDPQPIFPCGRPPKGTLACPPKPCPPGEICRPAGVPRDLPWKPRSR